MSPPGLDRLGFESAPAPFWPDVFVARALPWKGFLQSATYHGIALVLLLAFAHLVSLRPKVVPAAKFDHSEVVYYQASDLLPPLDTRRAPTEAAAKPDPELSRQPIISVPAEADSRSQTIVTPPKIKLKSDLALPNIVRSTVEEKKPRLAIPDAPLTTAAEIMRIAPKLDQQVAAPAPDAAQLRDRRKAVAWQSAVVAPPPELNAANAKNGFAGGLEPAMIAPPPVLDVRSMRTGPMNVAPSAVIAPAPRLPLAAERSLGGGRPAAGLTAEVVPPPPSLAGTRSSGGSPGAGGRVVVLNLHPAMAAPPDPPAGNRRGTFSATPEGHAGASGAAGSRSTASGSGNGGTSPVRSNLPSGLYVGKAAEKSSPGTGVSAGQAANSVNPRLLADARPPRVNSHPARSADTTQLSEPERKLFYGKKFYSLTLNMPNLNSAGGSWVVHFAEAKPESFPHAGTAPAADLSQPVATRTVDPAYPLELMRENVAGTVILYALIRADGSVSNVGVLRGVDERLNRFAREAVSQWRFQPATKNGVPVDVEATFQIPFRPAGEGTKF